MLECSRAKASGQGQKDSRNRVLAAAASAQRTERERTAVARRAAQDLGRHGRASLILGLARDYRALPRSPRHHPRPKAVLCHGRYLVWILRRKAPGCDKGSSLSTPRLSLKRTEGFHQKFPQGNMHALGAYLFGVLFKSRRESLTKKLSVSRRLQLLLCLRSSSGGEIEGQRAGKERSEDPPLGLLVLDCGRSRRLCWRDVGGRSVSGRSFGGGGGRVSGGFAGSGGLGFLILALDLIDVGNRLSVGRNVAVFLHFIRAGVIGGKREREIVVVELQQLFQVARASVDVLLRIENIFHAQACRGFREQLHQAAGVLTGNGFRVEMGLDLHHAGNEFGVHAIARSGRDHQVVKGRLIGGSWLCGRRLGNRRK